MVAICLVVSACAERVQAVSDGRTFDASSVFSNVEFAQLASDACSGRSERIARSSIPLEHIDNPGMGGQTVLGFAVSCQSYVGVEALLAIGASPNAQYDDGRSPLSVSAGLQNEEIFEVLLNNSEELGNMLDYDNDDIFFEALILGAARGDWNNFDLIVNSHYFPISNSQNDYLFTRLASASQWKKIRNLWQRGYEPRNYDILFSSAVVSRVMNSDEIVSKNLVVQKMIDDGFEYRALLSRRIEMNDGRTPVGIIELNNYRSDLGIPEIR